MKCTTSLHKKLLDLDLHSLNGALQLTRLIRGDAASDHGTADAACPSKSDLTGNEYVGDVLILAEEGEVEQNFNGFRVGCHDDHFRDSTVESFGGFGMVNGWSEVYW